MTPSFFLAACNCYVIAWAEDYWPNGRHIYYEGGEPEAFAAAIKDEFGLDVTSDRAWRQVIDDSEGGSFCVLWVRLPGWAARRYLLQRPMADRVVA